MAGLVYYSSTSENTHRFVEKLGVVAMRLPVDAASAPPEVAEPFVLVLPTYGGGDGKGAVPKPVIRFLNVEANRSLIRGVIAAGNTNFGSGYALAGDIVAQKCAVPLLYRFELLGTEEDVATVKQGLERFWTR
ncbi:MULTISPECIES: class Ib ribonucleoside-diphosphate reductase assembly flavoprotein NrdI [Devosia]|uniref:Protein NrdI n=1 Tax=Devosia equisanguinis TaxID=2490941 RepID=A0A447ICT5_9HYPH|nr:MULTISPECIES: class Ib ribonucleoside-diphosphate reductase assembly flavoprotein NrdI [Devosia]ODT48249.1 MAG: ribonucleotide reductase assembly protein NrdI [Pelagibacterium sp. SCN 63-126]ODU82946.1 MAG: ribonucleotide reductase assembly protein NrdI [Pelagibacterium sp. SCN 63-17]OJX42039.1 MAG: ribonucleotide reductase assembly protein NrdI [Devosia sp. 63-57]VDS05282.1 Putative NrdI-like protein [Devosia equisanguinis]